MTDIKAYFTPEEAAWVKSKGRGYIRSLVRADMTNDRSPSSRLPKDAGAETLAGTSAPAQPMSGSSVLRRVQGVRCKECGCMTMAGKCMVCGVKQ
jgi:hypothetical protein